MEAGRVRSQAAYLELLPPAMPATPAHYLLLADTVRPTHDDRRWKFVLQPIGDGDRVVAEDSEPEADANRLELLAVVRGLEALDGPAHVTLLCGSRYVRRGIRRELAQWRENDWRWEHFGKMVPIRDLDLWQRLDRALAIHNVEYCYSVADFGLRISDSELAIPASNSQSKRRREFPVKNSLADWGHGILSALNGPGGSALSRSA